MPKVILHQTRALPPLHAKQNPSQCPKRGRWQNPTTGRFFDPSASISRTSQVRRSAIMVIIGQTGKDLSGNLECGRTPQGPPNDRTAALFFPGGQKPVKRDLVENKTAIEQDPTSVAAYCIQLPALDFATGWHGETRRQAKAEVQVPACSIGNRKVLVRIPKF